MSRKNSRTSKKKGKGLNWLISIALLITIVSITILTIKVKSEIERSVLDKKGRINVVWNTQPVLLTSFSPQEKTLLVMVFPTDGYDDVPGGYGKYKLTSIWKLGTMENKEGLLLSRTVQKIVGIPVEAWIGQSEESWTIDSHLSEDAIKMMMEKIFSLKSLFPATQNVVNKKIVSNLSLPDMIWLWWQGKDIRINKVTVLNLSKFTVTQTDILPDGTKARLIDKNALDGLTKEMLEDKTIIKENLTISVKNSTSIDGLGGRLARILTNLGNQVVQVENSEEQNVSLCLTEKSKENSYTVKKIKSLINCQVQEKTGGAEDISVIIGRTSIDFF